MPLPVCQEHVRELEGELAAADGACEALQSITHDNDIGDDAGSANDSQTGDEARGSMVQRAQSDREEDAVAEYGRLKCRC